jgi:UDP-glucuronate decarboxylase
MDEVIESDLDQIKLRLGNFASKVKNNTFLVSGGAGFLGSWFCDVLISFGGRVLCVDNLVTSSEDNIKHLKKYKNFEFIEVDISKFKVPPSIDYIVHMASIASPPLYQKYPIETLDAGIFGIKNLLEYSKSHKVLGFLLTSTSEIYGDPSNEFIPTPENYYGYVSSFGPRSMYDESKRAEEAYCYAYFSELKKKGRNLPIRIARIFNTYGPRLDVQGTSQYGRVLMKFLIQALKGDPITIYGDGSQTRSFCYVTDQIVGLFKLLLEDDIDGSVVNLGNEKEISIFELTKKIIKVTDSKSFINLKSSPAYKIEDDPKRRCPDISKAKKLLGYSNSVGLEDGLQRTAHWAKQNLL